MTNQTTIILTRQNFIDLSQIYYDIEAWTWEKNADTYQTQVRSLFAYLSNNSLGNCAAYRRCENAVDIITKMDRLKTHAMVLQTGEPVTPLQVFEFIQIDIIIALDRLLFHKVKS